MLRAIPKGIFSQRIELFDGETQVASLKTSGWKERAEMEIDERHFQLYRERAYSGRFLLDHEGQVLASAVKPTALRDRFELHIGTSTCETSKVGLFSSSFAVHSGDEHIGQVSKEGWFTSKANVDLPDDWPIAIQVFVYWLVHLLWRRLEAAAAGV